MLAPFFKSVTVSVCQTCAPVFASTQTSAPDDLAENLVRTVNELHQQSSALAANSEAATSLRAQFQSDIDRYRELHSIHSQ